MKSKEKGCLSGSLGFDLVPDDLFQNPLFSFPYL
jgi:hypothetical protein